MKSWLKKDRLLAGTIIAGVSAVGLVGPAVAQESDEEIIVTGTRIAAPGVVSSSPVYSVGAEEIQLQQQPEVEKIIRILPITVPGDGQNVNNGTVGTATVNLRGLGSQRNLLMIDGQRIIPYDINGRVDTQFIPTALIDRIDIITGGASAVYGSDAMSGAINFVMKRDFEGVDLDYDRSITEENDGEINSTSLTLGANVADGRGNVTLSVNYTKRDGVQLGARPLGTLGIVTADGGGYAQFLAGTAPAAPPANCTGENAVAAGGSTTTLPTRVAIAGGPGLGQFRNDGTLAGNCSVFNFNPYNYYQTPQERFGGTAMGHYTINDHVEVYGRFIFQSTNVTQQVAPSGVFGNPFWTPLGNPLIGNAARTTILTTANTGRVAGTVLTGGDFPNWRDLNSNGVVDAADDLLIAYRRRTVELGPRSTGYELNVFQTTVGVRGEIVPDWTYDVYFSHGESDNARVNAGYTNVAHIEQQIASVDGTTCRDSTDSACVPINLFGGQGSITPAAAAYAMATALEKREYEQTVFNASISGLVPGFKSPWAESGLAVSIGTEYREETGVTTPDECLKLAPASCLGGAGGNTLPIAGGFSANEVFGEAILPLFSDVPLAHSLDLEVGYRYSDFDPSGVTRTWKYGANWEPVDGVRFRVMKQRAARAPNVGELAAPLTAGLDNANFDPCSEGNPGTIDATLRARCISTGMSNAQVGTVEDIVAGQINVFAGTDLANLPGPEEADTLTVGVVLTPDLGDFFRNPTLSVDYYDIKINNYINTFNPQEILDGCYVQGLADICSKIVRVGGTLTLPGSGVQTFTTNLDYLKAEGVELGASVGMDFGDVGSVTVSFNANHYLSNEFQSAASTGVKECVGTYSAACGTQFGTPLPETRWVQRTIWDIGDFQFSYLWRHLSAVEAADKSVVFDAFEEIDAFNYLDLTAAWNVTDSFRINGGVTNVTDEDPPVVGNEAADTGSNSGNTFPSTYDVLGRVFSVGFNLRL